VVSGSREVFSAGRLKRNNWVAVISGSDYGCVVSKNRGSADEEEAVTCLVEG